jgi:hypothetical protein
MTKYEIIDELSKDSTVEKIIYKLLPASKNRFDCPEDLIQDIYVLLLEKDDKLIIDLYNKGELGFYLLKIAKNQLLSANSPYFYLYIKFRVNSDDLENAAHIVEEDRRRVC